MFEFKEKGTGRNGEFESVLSIKVGKDGKGGVEVKGTTFDIINMFVHLELETLKNIDLPLDGTAYDTARIIHNKVEEILEKEEGITETHKKAVDFALKATKKDSFNLIENLLKEFGGER